MLSRNIGYHTRLIRDNTVKVCGGSFGGTLDYETVNRLVKSHFTVTVKPSGHTVFVDREGREVSLYLSVDAELTAKGMEAKKAWLIEKRLQEAAEEKLRENQTEELDSLMSGLTHEEIIRRLKKGE